MFFIQSNQPRPSLCSETWRCFSHLHTSANQGVQLHGLSCRSRATQLHAILELLENQGIYNHVSRIQQLVLITRWICHRMQTTYMRSSAFLAQEPHMSSHVCDRFMRAYRPTSINILGGRHVYIGISFNRLPTPLNQIDKHHWGSFSFEIDILS
jgi:hypothetical protein